MNLFGLHWSTLFGLASWQWTIILVPVALAALARLGRLAPRKHDGWFSLSPTIFQLALAPLFLAMAAAFAAFPVIAILAAQKDGTGTVSWILLVLGPPLSALSIYGFFCLALVRFRFNEAGIERRVIGRTLFLAWDNIVAIRRHWFFGPQIVCRSGKAYAVWEYQRGFNALVEAASSQGISVKV